MVAPESWPPYRRKLERYTRLLGEVYRGVQEVSGAALVVDSTKHYAGAFLLRRMAGVDLRVVHLVRDSRGVAFSWSKRVPRPEAMHRGSHMNRYGAGRSAGRWLGYNSGFEVLERLGIPSTFVRYEDLVRAPRPELARILERADRSGRSGVEKDDRRRGVLAARRRDHRACACEIVRELFRQVRERQQVIACLDDAL